MKATRRQPVTRKHNRTKKNKKNNRTMKKSATIKFDDVDYATDIDVLTIMSKDKQMAALNKVNQYLNVCKNKNKSHAKAMIERKKQIEALIKEN